MTSCALDTTASAAVTEPADLNAWNTVMTRLRAWYENPDQLVDENIVPPSSETIYKAYRLALAMRDSRSPGPLRVVPDGEGGSVFERQEGSVFETICIEATGRVEVMLFEGSRLCARRPVTLPQTHAGDSPYDASESEPSSSLSGSIFLSVRRMHIE
ncbi:MAG: hypothetical protein IT364_14065 [Candidatus Hydrogenedentes bacterium]|nr:hypothetical protein [Candidatus Hydrogenedentota bacterium]